MTSRELGTCRRTKSIRGYRSIGSPIYYSTSLRLPTSAIEPAYTRADKFRTNYEASLEVMNCCHRNFTLRSDPGLETGKASWDIFTPAPGRVTTNVSPKFYSATKNSTSCIENVHQPLKYQPLKIYNCSPIFMLQICRPAFEPSKRS